jgi:hypothetical protein
MIFMSFKEFFISGVKVLVVLGALSKFVSAEARELTDLNIDITTEKRGSEAKQEAFDQATEQATQKTVEEILGPDRAAKYWPGLRAKLLKNSTRFIVFIKGSPAQEAGGNTKITVNLRLSPDNLETLLREEGITGAEGLKVLPLVEFVDGKGVHYAWWADTGDLPKGSALADMFRKFSLGLAGKFKARNIYVFDPLVPSFRMSVPASYRSASLRREDQMSFAQYMKADIVLSGRLAITRSAGEGSDLKLGYDLQMWQAKSGRALAEEQRLENLASEAPKVLQAAIEQADNRVFTGLLGRVTEALASGDLNLNVVRLAVNGSLNYRQEAEFKRLLSQVREIKVLKERLFEPSRVVFDAETAVSGTDLAKTLQKTKFPLYSVEVQNSQDDSLALSVRALGSAQ